MQSLVTLTSLILNESGEICCTSTKKDLETVLLRFQNEGESFLTITLPTFANSLQKALDIGRVVPSDFPSFKKSGCLPAFLRGFTELVFDRETGVLLDYPDIDAIRAIRQICLLHQKVRHECSEGRIKSSYRKYVECEYDVKRADKSRSEIMISDFARVSRVLYANIFSEVDRKIYEIDDVFPSHGPGATAEKRFGNQKFLHRSWPARLEKIFPMSEFIIPNGRFVSELDAVDIIEPGAEMPVRVITVPKTMKTPRIIAIEPVAMQYAQQAVSRLLVPALESDEIVGPMIGFTDQTPNQRMAREGSLSGELATLDLSEASDRVSNQLVRTLFSRHPWLSQAVDASRSRKADVPGFGVLRLAKFASMGSALCFPVEAMVFLTICLIGIEKALNTHVTPRLLKKLSGFVRVYGDDIIVPVGSVHHVITELESFGFKVGTEKSFWTGKFRESCGKEYYDGSDVCIVRNRASYPSSREDAEEVISLVSFRNQLYRAGYWKVASVLDEDIERILVHFPVVHPGSDLLGRESFLEPVGSRFCPRLHIPLSKGYVVVAKPPVNKLDGSAALLKFFIKVGENPLDAEHLQRSGRPKSVKLKLRWSSPV